MNFYSIVYFQDRSISLDFDDLVTVDSIELLDIDESGSLIAFYDENSNLIETVEIASRGEDIASLDINLAGSGAVTGIDFRGQPIIALSQTYKRLVEPHLTEPMPDRFFLKIFS